MLVNGNLVGIAMFVLAAVFIAAGKFIIGLSDPVVMIVAGATIVTADLILRITNRGKAKWLMGDRTGGYLFFIPVWVFGVAVIAINAINAVIKAK